MLEEKDYYIEKIHDVMHLDGWGYRITTNEEYITIQYVDKGLGEDGSKDEELGTDKIEISTLLIRAVAKEILNILPEEK